MAICFLPVYLASDISIAAPSLRVQQGKGYDFETLKKISLFSSRVGPDARFDPKTAIIRTSYEF